MNATRQQILDCAETAIKSGGYSAFSFRSIADQLDIKSASVHYHFPNKDDLVLAATERYCEQFFEAIGDAGDSGALDRYLQAFDAALGTGQGMCLCAVLATEAELLTETVAQRIGDFAKANQTWLKSALEHRGRDTDEAASLAYLIFASLEGGITFARISRDRKFLDEAMNGVRRLID